ncbi:MAG TPA: hypothetical protein VMS56_16265 [Thermoanaerobaculia bacterium]|nr:hypothetical protein [Thermoanaerobaculia bacterium]
MAGLPGKRNGHSGSGSGGAWAGSYGAEVPSAVDSGSGVAPLDCDAGAWAGLSTDCIELGTFW